MKKSLKICKKKIYSLILALSMIMTFMPMSVNAKSTEPEIVDLLHDTAGNVRVGVIPTVGGSKPTLGKGNIDDIIDGDISTFTYTNIGDNMHYQIDLGAERVITELKFRMMDYAFDSNKWRHRLFKIMISSDSEFKTGVTTICTVGNLGSDNASYAKMYIVDLSGKAIGGLPCETEITSQNALENMVDDAITVIGTPKKARYIRIQKSDLNSALSCSEVMVSGYGEDEFGDWIIRKNTDNTEFEIPVKYFGTPKDYTMILSNYDEYGFMTNYCETTVTGNTFGASINTADTDACSQAVLVNNTADMNVAAPISYSSTNHFSKNNGVADLFENAIDYVSGEEIAELSGRSVNSKDYILVSAIKSDADNAKTAFENHTGAPLYFAAVQSGDGYKFSIPFKDGGKYYIRVMRYGSSFDIEYRYFEYNMVDKTIRQECINGFVNTDGSDLADLIDYASKELGIIPEESIIDVETAKTQAFAETFTTIRDIMVTDSPDTDDILNIINTALAVYYVDNNRISELGDNKTLITENEDIRIYVEETLKYSINADVTSTIDNHEGVVTNIDSEGYITFSFTEDMDISTLTKENIIIKKGKDVVSYEPLKTDASSFMIDKSIFASDSEYSICFTTGCLTENGYKMTQEKVYSFKTGIILPCPYKKGKVIKCVTLNKPITGEISSSVDGVKENLVDGKTNTRVSFTKEEGAVIDLQGYYDLCGIYFKSTTNMTWHYDNTVISATAYNSDFSDEVVVLYNIPSGNYEFVEKVDSKGKVRYIKLLKTDMTLIANEFSAFSYVDNSETGFFEDVEFSGAGDYTFSVPSTATENYVMLISAYDNNGEILAKTITEVRNTNNQYKASVTVPENTKGISAMLVTDIVSMKQVNDPIIIGETLANTTESGSGISISASDTEIKVGLKSDKVLRKSDRTSVIILKNEETGKSAEQTFKDITIQKLSEQVIYMTANKCNKGSEYKIVDPDMGKYYIRVTTTNVNGEQQHKYYKFVKQSEEAKTGTISSFMSADSTQITSKLNEMLNSSEIITEDNIADISIISDNQFAKYVTYARDMLYPQGNVLPTEITEIVDIINAATILNEFSDGDVNKVTELMSEYGSVLKNHIDSEADIQKSVKIFEALKNNVNDATSLENVLKWSQMLSYFENGSNTSKANAMTKYASQLGIDLAVAQANGVTLERVGANMISTGVSSIYGTVAFNAAYTNAVALARAEKGGTAANVPGNSYSGSGGGGASNKSFNTTQVVQPPVTQAQTEIDIPFNDISGFDWAKDAIKTLYEKEIINGTGDGNFLPDNNITRAEFVKMLVMATRTEVVEKTQMHFIDVTEANWYYPYIKIAYSNMLCSGVSEYYFNPTGYITRQDMAVIINNYLAVTGNGTSGEKKNFTDFELISDYAKDSVSKVAESGIINGYEDGSFRPLDNARRVDAVMVIAGILNLIS